MKRTLRVLLALMLCLSVALFAVSCNGDDSDGSDEGSSENGGNTGNECGDNTGNEGGDNTVNEGGNTGNEGGNTEGEGGNTDGDGTGDVDTRVNPCKVCATGEYVKEVKPATAFEDGEEVFTCPVCSDSYTNILPATGEVKLLLIGDASISDSVSLLTEMLHGVGVNRVIVGTMVCNFTSGASLETHAKNISASKTQYTVSVNGDAENIKEYSQTFLTGITLYDWDYIAIGQSVPLSGLIDSYSSLGDILNYIDENKTNEYAKILWHMPWALNNGSTVKGFDEYDNDEDKMYEAIKEVTESIVSSYELIDGVVSTGTAIQNMRATFMSDSLKISSIRLTDIGKICAAYTWCSYLTGADAEKLSDVEVSLEADARYVRIARDAAVSAADSAYEIIVPETKTISLLAFGNSYSNDAITFLTNIFLSAGYDVVVIGSISDGGCNLFHHWSNVDDTLEDFHPGDDYHGLVGYEGTAGCSIKVNGKTTKVAGATLKDRYINTISAYDWDFVTIQHAPKEVEQLDTYEKLPDLLQFIKSHLTSDKTEFVFHMIWKYNDNIAAYNSTARHYDTIIDIAQNFVLVNEEFSRLIPAVTMRQNMSSSFLEDVDIARDYGHMGLTLGRYALGLLWYCVLTGGSVDDVTFVPTAANVDPESITQYAGQYNHVHLEITEADMLVVKEAIENALDKPFEVTQSQYVTAP
ncbi:MAG: DUF4886 domain-containing protein [Clostridia bacterium]|nr:DUF4886 domain-containing protein [Clostridia bacterium]